MQKKIFDIILDHPYIGCRVRIKKDSDNFYNLSKYTGTLVSISGEWVGVDIDPKCLKRSPVENDGAFHNLHGKLPAPTGRFFKLADLELSYE